MFSFISLRISHHFCGFELKVRLSFFFRLKTFYNASRIMESLLNVLHLSRPDQTLSQRQGPIVCRVISLCAKCTTRVLITSDFFCWFSHHVIFRVYIPNVCLSLIPFSLLSVISIPVSFSSLPEQKLE